MGQQYALVRPECQALNSEQSSRNYLSCPSCGQPLSKGYNRRLRPCCENCAPPSWLQMAGLLPSYGGRAIRHGDDRFYRRPLVCSVEGLRGSEGAREAYRRSAPNRLVFGIYSQSDSLICFELDFWPADFDLTPQAGSRLEEIWLRQRDGMFSQLGRKDRSKIRSHFGPRFITFSTLRESTEGWKNLLCVHLGDNDALRFVGASPALPDQPCAANLIQ